MTGLGIALLSQVREFCHIFNVNYLGNMSYASIFIQQNGS
jgi:hypothetical protein